MSTYTLINSTRKGKKYAIIISGDRTKTVHFGADGYEDYTTHKDPKRKEAYISRHEKNEDWTANGIKTAGFWSRWLLWNKPTIRGSLSNINKQFGIRVVNTIK